LRTGIATSEDRQLVLLWLVAAVSAILLRPLWLAIAPALRPCVFRAWTGVPCPSCGTTRAAVAFLGGHLPEAFALNPLAAAVGFAFVAGAPLAVLWVFSGLPVPSLSGQMRPWVRWAVVAAICGNWVYLILTR